MAGQKENRNHDDYEVTVGSEDVDYIVQQINSALSLTRSGRRINSHLAKRLRKSKAILLSNKENSSLNLPTKRSQNKLVVFLRMLFRK